MKISIKYNCGCGVVYNNPVEAIFHVESTKHTVGVLGTIEPSNDKRKEVRNGKPISGK